MIGTDGEEISLANLEKTLGKFYLSGARKTLAARLNQAASGNLSHREFLAVLLEDETVHRADSKQARLYQGAHFPFAKELADFDFAFQPSVSKAEILDLSTGSFLANHTNLLFVGQPGTGKTHLAVALGLSVLRLGKTVLFTTLFDMITSLRESRADMSYPKKLAAYLKPDLLILDELGYRSLAGTTTEDFFEIVSRRYEKGSIIITSNRNVSEWDKVFADKTLTTAVLDRLMHHCRVIEIKGESYRIKHQEKS